MKVYIVCWGNASQDDHGNSTAYTGVHGVYASLEEAQKALVECKDQIYNEIVFIEPDEEDPEIPEIAQRLKDSTQVYGSVEDGYFEIDYESWDILAETYIKLEEKEVIG